MEKVVLIEVDTMNKILAVLGAMPFNQVSELIAEIQNNTNVVDRPSGEAETE